RVSRRAVTAGINSGNAVAATATPGIKAARQSESAAKLFDGSTVSATTRHQFLQIGVLQMIKFLLSDVPDPPERPLVISYTSKAVNISWAPGVNSHNTPISQYVIYTR
ncbi:hypothetical protein DBV15_05395, partial [Temnothorax longispinosus]